MELGIEDLNDTGGIDGRPVQMLLRDTAGTPERAVRALEEFDADRVVAVVGEFHSAVARPLAELVSGAKTGVRRT